MGSLGGSLTRVGTLGSVLTFAGQATAALLDHRPDLDSPVYLPTMDAVVDAVLDGTIDLGVLTSETSRTACTDTVARMLGGDQLFVVDEIVVPYHCALLGKPGSRLEDIRHVGGHGSLRQCAEFLRTELPDASVEMHRLNSVAAAREVLDGDGTSAVVATEALATEFGLDVIARDVDGGAIAGWWALARQRRTPAGADHIAVLVDGSEALETSLARIAEHGLRVRTITNQPSGEVFRYRYLVTARTPDGSPVGDAALASFGLELVGVFASLTVT